jgi:hypothetical protein
MIIQGYRVVNSHLQSAIAAMLFVAAWVMIGYWQSDRDLHASSAPPPEHISTSLAAKNSIVVLTPFGGSIKTKSLLPTPAVNSESKDVVAGAIQAITAIVTAQPVEPARALVMVPTPPVQARQTAESGNGRTLALFVSVQVEGGGRLPISVNGRYPRLRLTKIDTNIPYEMRLNSVFIDVPLNLETRPDEYKVSVEDLPDGYSVKSITYPADEPGVRLVDVKNQNLQISSRAINAAFRSAPRMWGAPDLPITVTLSRISSPAPAGIRVRGSSEGMIVIPRIPILGGNLGSTGGTEVEVLISGKSGTVYGNGEFEFDGVSPGLHSVILISNMGGNGEQHYAAAEVVVRDRDVESVALQPVPFLPKNYRSARALRLPADNLPPSLLSSLTVRVLDESTQKPIDSAYVTISGVGAPTQIYFSTSMPARNVPNVLPGEYDLTAGAYGYQSSTHTITVGVGNNPIDLSIARNPK